MLRPSGAPHPRPLTLALFARIEAPLTQPITVGNLLGFEEFDLDLARPRAARRAKSDAPVSEAEWAAFIDAYLELGGGEE
jgi:hypothetical protein